MFAHFHWPNWVQSSDPALEILTSQPPAARAARRTPIVFVHGAFMGAWSWQPNFLDYFASQGFHAIAPSLRGHGGSEGIERLDSASINDYVNDLATVVGELNGPPPILVGHSMGALVVQRYMERATVSAAVLMAPVPPHGLMSSTLRMITTDPMLYWQFGMMQFFGAGTVDSNVAQRAVFSETTPREDLESYAELVQRESQRALWDMNVHARGRPRLVSGDVPMHVIAGAEDALFNARETKAVANVWDATWEELPGLAHAMMIEPGWERSADAIIEWLGSRNIG